MGGGDSPGMTRGGGDGVPEGTGAGGSAGSTGCSHAKQTQMTNRLGTPESVCNRNVGQVT